MKIEDLFTASKTQGVIVKDITLQVTEEKGKLIVTDYYLFINLEYVIAGKSLFIPHPNNRSLTL